MIMATWKILFDLYQQITSSPADWQSIESTRSFDAALQSHMSQNSGFDFLSTQHDRVQGHTFWGFFLYQEYGFIVCRMNY